MESEGIRSMSRDLRTHTWVFRNGDRPPRWAVRPIAPLIFRYWSGGQTFIRCGTGFFLAPFRDTLVTAAHVIALAPEESPVELVISICSEAGDWENVHASIYAYPVPYRRKLDVALLRLADGVRSVSESFYPCVVAQDTDATLLGYSDEGRFIASDVRCERWKSWFRYGFGAGVSGMSGSPVVCEHGVLGVHIGDFDVGSRYVEGAWAIDADVLDALDDALEEGGAT